MFTIDRQTLLLINKQSRSVQKTIWKDNFKEKVKGVEPKLLRSKIRGKRSGVRQRIKDCKYHGKIKLNLPTISLTNANRIYNKLDELEALVNSKQLRNCCCLAITETWLDSTHTDNFISISGYTSIRQDRDPTKTNKQLGGGLLLYINDNWSNSYSVVSNHIAPDIEIMVVKVRPYWLPREIACVFLIIVYCPLFDCPTSTKVKEAVARIHDTIESTEQQNPAAAVLVLGDFNSASVKLHRYKQNVTCTTRNDKTLDKCYAPKAFEYKCFKMPKLGASDHHSVLLLPKNHRLTDHTSRPKKITKQIWSAENISKLQNCLDDTEWSIFFQNPSVETQAEQITDYLQYCVDQTIHSQTTS